jgi:hypothetical protein
MRGLDPRIHAEIQQVTELSSIRVRRFSMDRRVKPGGDD